VGQGRKGPGECQWEVEVVGRLLVLGQPEYRVFEREKRPRIDFEGQVEVEGATAPVFGVELHLPDLAERVGLDEMALVVHMEAMVNRVILEIGHVPGHIDDCHRCLSLLVSSLLRYRQTMDDDGLLEVLHAAASAVTSALGDLSDWGLAGTRTGQYRSDLAADAAALAVLDQAGLGVMSEESGTHRLDRPVVVVIDPVDGSTNAARGIPWYATSLCALDAEGPRVSVVVNQASGVRFEAVRGGGARKDGAPIRPSRCEALGEAIVGFSGYPPRYFGWSQYRGLGAAALDLCAVAEGVLDGYAVVGGSQLGSWDYLGGMLICTESGAVVGESHGRELVTLEHRDRRTPVAASTPTLLQALCTAAAQ
jgi:myo-inositol-1(or 4)-monophosphatase